MKNNLVRVSMLVLAAAAVYAQSPNVVYANIPFDFSARGMNLPAGKYLVDTRTPSFVIFRSSENGKSAIVAAGVAESILPREAARLVFHRYGNQHFLAEVWIAGSTYARQIPMTKQERNLAKSTEPGEQVVAAR